MNELCFVYCNTTCVSFIVILHAFLSAAEIVVKF